MTVRRYRPIVLCLIVMAGACFLPLAPEEVVSMSGTVYGRFVDSQTTDPGTYADPVAGAVLSTSLDSATATTDASGRYTLVTNTKQDGCAPFTVTIRAAGRPTYIGHGTWPPTGQIFALDPPMPSEASLRALAGTNPNCR